MHLGQNQRQARFIESCLPSPDTPRGVPSVHPIFASSAKPLFVLLILVSTVITSRAGLRTCSSYKLESFISTSLSDTGDGERETIDTLSSELSSSSSAFDLGRW